MPLCSAVDVPDVISGRLEVAGGVIALADEDTIIDTRLKRLI